ncbi:hypothetical protein B0J14DRAFT_567864 [Halenospora varia]|nr:hypothetical protein B0J14DRAFT_567864 [Halenospora varia]
MIDAAPNTEVIVPQGLEHLIGVDTKNQRVTCHDVACMYSEEPATEQWPGHLLGHKIPWDLVVEASSFIRGLGWEKPLMSRQAVPPNGSAPQPGTKVIDGVRCKYCRVFMSTNTMEVKMHWELEKHGVSDGCLVELIRLQSWARNDYEQHTYWEVDEGTKRSGANQGVYEQVAIVSLALIIGLWITL